MADPAKRHTTYEALLAVPDHLVAEIVNGEIITSPRPSIPLAGATSALGGHPLDVGDAAVAKLAHNILQLHGATGKRAVASRAEHHDAARHGRSSTAGLPRRPLQLRR